MRNKLTVLDKIKLEGYINEDIYLTKKNRKYENIDKIAAHFKVLGFNEEDTKYLVIATIMPIEEIKEYINYYDTNKCNLVDFINEIIGKYLENNINLRNSDREVDKKKYRTDRNLVIERIQDVRGIVSLEKELSNTKVRKRSLFSVK